MASLLKLGPLAFIGIAALVLAVIASLFFLFGGAKNNNQTVRTPASIAGDFSVAQIPLNGLVKDGQISLDSTRQLSINGQLRVNNSFVLAPTSKPSSSSTGQIYYDQTSNELFYFNGSQFLSLATNQALKNLTQGTLDNISRVGDGLAVQGQTLANTGVLSIQGQSDDVTFTAGDGIGINGLIINNTGVTGVNGTANQITVSAANGNVMLALPQDISPASIPTFAGITLTAPLGVASGGTGSSAFTVNSVVVSNGSGVLGTATSGAAGQCFRSNGASTPTFQACPGGSGTGDVTAGTQTAGRLTKWDAVANQIADSLIAESGTTITVNGALSVVGTVSGNGSGLTSVNAAQLGGQAGSFYQSASNINAGTLNDGRLSVNVTLQGNSFNGDNQLIQLDSSGAAAGAGECLLSTAGGTSFAACPGGGDVSHGSVPTHNNLTKFDATGNIINSLLSDNGTDVSQSSGNLNLQGGGLEIGGTTVITSSRVLQNVTTDTAILTSGILAVARGGSGASSFTASGLLLGNGTSAISALAPGLNGQCLVIVGGAPAYAACPGAGGVASLDGLTGAITLAAGTGIQIDNNQPVAGSIRVTNSGVTQLAVTANKGISVSSATGNVTLDLAQDIRSTADIAFNQLTLGLNGGSAGALLLSGSTANSIKIQAPASPNSGLTFTLPGTAGTANDCLRTNGSGVLSFSSCTSGGSGGGVTSPGGTTDKIAKFTNGQTIGDSNITDDGAVVTVVSGAVVQGASGLTIGTNSVLGALALKDGSNNTTTLQSASIGSDLTFTLPASAGSSGQCLTTNGSGVLSFATCLSGSGGGGGVTDLNGNSGSITINGTANQVSVTGSGINPIVLSTPQNIDTAANVAFRTISLAGTTAGDNLIVANAVSGASGNLLNLKTNNVSKLSVDASGNSLIAGTLGVSGAVTLSNLGTGIVHAGSGGALTSSAVGLASSDVSGILAVANGGTGATALTTNGLLLGNSTSAVTALAPGSDGQCLLIVAGAPAYGTCTGAGGVSSVNGSNGSVTINGTANQVSVTGNGINPIVLSTPQDIATSSAPSFAGLSVTTNAGLTLGTGTGGNNGKTIYRDGSSAFSATLQSAALSGSNKTITLPNATGTVCLQSSVSCGFQTAGSYAASGANSDITSLTGLTTTLSVAQGGTGQTSYTDGQLLIGNSVGNGLSKATLTAGSGVTITNGNGAITISAPGSGSCASCANATLSNLGTTAINANLLSATTNTIDIGSSSSLWQNGYFGTNLQTPSLQSAAASALSVDSGTTSALNVGTGANAKTITIGNTTGATNLILNNGSGTVAVGANGGGDILLGGGSGATGCTVTNSSGNLACTGNITGATTGTVGYFSRSGTIVQPATAGDSITTSGNISTSGSGTVTSAGLLTAQAGLTVTGAVTNLNASSNFGTNINTGTSNGAVAIGNNTGNTSITLDSGTAAINIGAGAQSRTTNIATGAAAQTLSLGSSDASSTTLIQGGTGVSAVSIQSGGAGTISVGSTTTNGVITVGGSSQTGTLTIGQSTSSNTIAIGNATIATGNTGTISIGTSATGTGKTAITIGSTNGASSVTLQGGTGGITATGSLTVSGNLVAQSGLYTGASGGTLRIDTNGTLQNVKFGSAVGALVTDSSGSISVTSGATSSQCLISNGSSTAPSFQTCPGGSATAFTNGGNSFGATPILGVNDGQLLTIRAKSDSATLGGAITINGTNGIRAVTIQGGTSGKIFSVQDKDANEWLSITTNGDVAIKSAGTDKIKIDSAGDVYAYISGSVGATQLCASGSSGSVRKIGTCSSSEAYKHNIQALSDNDYTSILDKIQSTDIFRYNHNTDMPEFQRTGVISEHMPTELTYLDSAGHMIPDWFSVYGYLWAGERALADRTDQLASALGAMNTSIQSQGASFGELNVSGESRLSQLTVTGTANFEGDIVVAGHIITSGGQPSPLVQSGAGSGASVSVSGTDTTGTISITTGANTSAGELVKLLFSKTYGVSPHVVLSPSNDAAADLHFFKGTTSTTSFIFNAKSVPLGHTTYVFDYFIAQ